MRISHRAGPLDEPDDPLGCFSRRGHRVSTGSPGLPGPHLRVYASPFGGGTRRRSTRAAADGSSPSTPRPGLERPEIALSTAASRSASSTPRSGFAAALKPDLLGVGIGRVGAGTLTGLCIRCRRYDVPVLCVPHARTCRWAEAGYHVEHALRQARLDGPVRRASPDESVPLAGFSTRSFPRLQGGGPASTPSRSSGIPWRHGHPTTTKGLPVPGLDFPLGGAISPPRLSRLAVDPRDLRRKGVSTA